MVQSQIVLKDQELESIINQLGSDTAMPKGIAMRDRSVQLLVPQAGVPGKRGATEILHPFFCQYCMQTEYASYIPRQVDSDKRADTTL